MVKVLRSPGQVGNPPNVATDARLGYSAMAYQAAEVVFGRCEGLGSLLARSAGTCARGLQGSKRDDIARGCARPSHVAAPCRYVVGDFYGHKAHGIQSWQDHGPWAARCLAATLWAGQRGHFPFGIGLPNL